MNTIFSNTEQNVSYIFDGYTLDVGTRTLRHGQEVVELTPKLFQTLLVLVENRDHIMSKDELLSSIWPEQIVEEANITQNISVLRKILGEATRGKKYIETFPGHGYRFSEPVAIDRDIQQNHRTDFSEKELFAEDFEIGVSSRLDNDFPPIQLAKQGIFTYRGYVVTGILCLIIGAICSAVVFNRRTRPQKQQATLAPPVQLKTLTGMEGAQYQPSWSRDGKNIAFVYSVPDDSRSAIYIQTSGEIQPHRVVSGPGKYSSPVWSPDGKSLAYLHIQTNKIELFIFNIAQSTSKKLTTLFPHRYGLNYRHLDWSPDGKMLVVDDKDVESDPLSLYLVYVSNGSRTRLTFPDMDMIGDVSPRFSPDGSQVVFIRMKYQFQSDVFLVPVTGGAAKGLIGQPISIGDVDWESNHSLVFSAKYADKFRFWRLNLLLPHPHAVVASSIESDLPLQLSISRKSRQVAFSAYRPDLNIWALKLPIAPDSAADWTPVIRTAGEDMAPSFSPDGAKLSFRSNISGKMQIWISRADSSHATPVDTGNMIPAVNCWAPDGNSIVFSPRLSHGLYDVSLQHQFNIRQIASQFSHPFYSVDGKWIFARVHNFIYRVPIRGGTAVLITDEGGAPIVQSKDGNYLYFGHGRMSSTISRLDLKTKNQEVILNSLMPGSRDSWALTPTGIIFLTERSGRPMIALHDFATGKERNITDFVGDPPPIGTSGFSISPDGHRLLVVRADPVSANIQMMALSSTAKP